MPETGLEASGNSKSTGLILGVFLATVVVFLLLIAFIFTQQWIPSSNMYFEYVFFPGIAALSILGIALIILAARTKLQRGLRLALMLTGISAVGMPASAILHNLVYGLFIILFGGEFWERFNGGDEAFFFILALFAFPAVLVISAIVAAVLFRRATRGSDT